MLGDFAKLRNESGLALNDVPVTPNKLGGLIDSITDGTISGRTAKDVLQMMWDTGKDAQSIIEEKGLKQVSDASEISTLIDKIIAENPNQVEQARNNPKLKGWFVGQVMKATDGQANPGVVNKLLSQKLTQN